MFQILRQYASLDLNFPLRAVHCNWFCFGFYVDSFDFLLQLSNGSLLSLVYDSLRATIISDLLHL